MFNLERTERFIIAFLIASLLVGIGYSYYNRNRPVESVDIEKFTIDNPVRDELLDANTGQGAIINVNKADIDELVKLRGIGGVLARRIIEYRDLNGPFQSSEQIMKVKGIGPVLYEKISDSITAE